MKNAMKIKKIKKNGKKMKNIGKKLTKQIDKKRLTKKLKKQQLKKKRKRMTFICPLGYAVFTS